MERNIEELAHTTVGLASLNSAGQTGDPGKVMLQLKSKGSLEAKFLPSLGSSVFSLKAFN